MEFVVPDLIWGKKKIPYTTCTWSGTDAQASREISFEIPWNPTDKKFPKWNIKKGDVVELRVKGKAIFIGTITSRDKTDQIGTASYVAKDFMHHLLKSSGTYIFKKTTPEAIAKKVCTDMGIGVSGMFKTGVTIKKMIFENQNLYDIIIKAYRKVKAETGKNYMPVMAGTKVAVIEKGGACGSTLTQGVNITGATYSDTVDNMVDLVKIYNDKHKKVGEVKNSKHVSTYGVYQQVYQKEEGKNATNAAKAMLQGTTREASVEALGDIRAVSGYSIQIKDPATGLTGKFFITADTHTFTNSTHMMSLDLSWKDTMEQGAEVWKKEQTMTQDGTTYTGSSYSGTSIQIPKVKVNTGLDKLMAKDAKEKANNQWCYYLDVQSGSGYMGTAVYAQTYYHSTTGCSQLNKEKKKYNVGTTYGGKVRDVKKQRRIIRAPQTYGYAHKTCPCCWKAGKYGELMAAETAKIKGTLATTDDRYTQTQNAINTKTDPRFS